MKVSKHVAALIAQRDCCDIIVRFLVVIKIIFLISFYRLLHVSAIGKSHRPAIKNKRE
jgi:hypothetical protein